MSRIECCREEDVLDALSSGRWPERADGELRAHVAGCAVCGDVVDVASAVLALDGSSQADRGEMHIPSSAVMWWRAQMRARQEAARTAAKPVAVAHVVAFVSAVVLVAGTTVALLPWLGSVLGEWVNGARTVAADVAASGAPAFLAGGWTVPALMIGVWMLLAPVAIYLVVAKD